MTVRAKPVSKRSSRSSRDADSRRTLLLNLGFAAVVVAAIAILLAAAGASYYGDHLTAVATVNGQTITRDDYRVRYAIEDWRINEAESRVRDEAQAGRLTSAQASQTTSALDQEKQNLSTSVLQKLEDASLEGQLAKQEGLSVTSADVDQQMLLEATRPEERHIYAIEVAPQGTGSAAPTDAQIAAAKAKAEQALQEIQAGQKFEDVAKALSTGTTAAQGGDLGWFSANSSLDKPFLDAMFAAKQNAVSGVITGADGTFRVGKVVDISPKTVDQNYQQTIKDAGISIDDYRAVVGSDLLAQRLSDKITASLTDQATVQRRVGEIYVPQPSGVGDEVQVSHILFAPNHITDSTQLQALPSTDPGWAKAKADAQAAYDQLKAYSGTQLETEFAKLASAESDDSGSKSSGGQLPWITQDQLDTGFGAAVFKSGLTKDELIGPVQSSFGWHVILFEGRRPGAEQRIQNAGLAATAKGADFATVAKQYSEGPDASTGGDLGWVARYQLSTDKEKAIFDTPVGGTSSVINVANDGLYIFHVYEQATRKATGTQLDTLKASAFTNWYAAKKAAASITEEQANLPSVTTF